METVEFTNSPSFQGRQISRRSMVKGAFGGLAVVAVGPSLLAACSSAESGDERTSATVTIVSPLITLDPPLINAIALAAAVRHTIESFVSLDSQGRVVPALAESWEVAPDKVTWTMNLRQGVKFHDGSAWTSEVAKMNLDRYLSQPEKFPRAQQYAFVKEVRSVDEGTLQLVTESPQSGFMNWMSFFALGFHSADSLDKYGDEVALHGVGTGPFKVSKFVPNESLELSRFESYWGDVPKLETLTVRTVPDAAGRVSMLETGEADVAVALPTSMLPTVTDNNSLAVERTPSVRMAFIGINSQNPDLKDVRVRRAINHAVDAASILKTVLNGEGTLADSVMPAAIPGHAAQTPYEFDVDEAARLLDEAGWRLKGETRTFPDGRPVVLTIRTTDGYTAGDRAICESVAGYLADVGIKTKIEVIDQNQYFAVMGKEESIKTTHLNFFAFGSNLVEPTHALQMLEGSWSNVNSIYARYRSDQFDAEYKKMVAAVDDEKARDEAAAKAQEIAWNDAPWIFLFSLNSLLGRQQAIQDVTDSPQEFWDMTKSSFK